jgi:hypothetical protein
MADLPGILNRVDFFGVLPGYIAVILSAVLFFPDFLTKVGGEDAEISADIFSAVVFLVAGPAIGYTVKSFHRNVYSIVGLLTKNNRTKRKKNNNLYAKIRINATKDDREELDLVEAAYDFNVSTAAVLILIGLFYIVLKGPIAAILIPLFALSAIFLFGGAIERRESFGPVVHNLREKLSIA